MYAFELRVLQVLLLTLSCVYKSMHGATMIRNDCSLETSKNDTSAGRVRNLSIECRYNVKLKKFYYLISWKAPEPVKTTISRYRVMITYGPGIRYCFQVPNSNHEFVYNEANGFRRGIDLRYAVTAEPVVRAGGKYSTKTITASGCPRALKLKSLENIALHVNANHTFKCEFETPPVPEATVRWLFTQDIKNCNNPKLLQNTSNIHISNDTRTLKIMQVSASMAGCYVLSAQNIVEGAPPVKAFLSLLKNPPLENNREVIILIICVVIVVIAFPIIGIVLHRQYRRKVKRVPHDESRKPDLQCYISHCCVDENEHEALGEFERVLNTHNIGVIVDNLSINDINTAGGLMQWIPVNMKRADKIVIILTKSYVNSLCTNDVKFDVAVDSTSKVHCEYRYIENILYQNRQNFDDIIIISKGVEPKNFPPLLQNKRFFRFPKYLHEDNNDCQKIIEVIRGQHLC